MDTTPLFLGLAMTLAGVGLVTWLVLKLLRSLGGAGLAARYGASAEPPGMRYGGQTIAIGAVRHRLSGTVVVGPAGLYARGAVAGDPILVPWAEIDQVSPSTIYQRPAMELSIGRPRLGSITVFPELFEAMRPYLGDKAGVPAAPAALSPGQSGMEPPILFATPCRWIKFDLDPDAAGDRSTPLRGTLRVGGAGLEFIGFYKSYGGTLLAGLLTDWFVKWLGEIRQSIPLHRLRRVEAIRFDSRFLFFKVAAVRLEVFYASGDGDTDLRKMVCFPHFGLAPQYRPGASVVLAPRLAHLYQRGDAEADNWARVLRHLAGIEQAPGH